MNDGGGRRAFLKTMGVAALALPLESALGRLAAPDQPSSPLAAFDPIAATDLDDVVLPEGFAYDVVIKWGDAFTAGGDRFGFNNDFIGVFRLGSDDDALLFVNHEYVSLATTTGNVDLYGQTFRMLRGHAATVRDYKRDVGASVVRLRRDGATGAWRPVLRDKLNRRINAFTPIRCDGPADPLMRVPAIQGTFDNCAGGVTPWGTALSCEENIQARVPEEVDTRGRYARGGLFDLPGGHYGWVVEVDPHDSGSTPGLRRAARQQLAVAPPGPAAAAGRGRPAPPLRAARPEQESGTHRAEDEAVLASAVVLLLTGPAPAVAPPFASPGDLQRWLTDYHRAPRPDLVVAALEAPEAELPRHGSTLEAAAARGGMRSFFGKVLATSPAAVRDVEEHEFAPGTRRFLAEALRRCGTAACAEARARLGAPAEATLPDPRVAPVDSADAVDDLWASYSATGDAACVERVIDALPEGPASASPPRGSVAGAALWSLTSNAARDPDVLALCRSVASRAGAARQPALEEVVRRAERTRPAAGG